MLTIVQVFIWMLAVLAIKAVFVLGFDVTVVSALELVKGTKIVEVILWLLFAVGMTNWPSVDREFRDSFSQGTSTRLVEQPDGTMVESVQLHFSCTNDYEGVKKARKYTLVQIVVTAVGSVLAAAF